MKAFLQFMVTIVVVGGFGAGSITYIAGRIMLPELHLPVPAYGAFFWACFWLSLFCAVVAFLAELIRD